ncbi:MAG TPA: methyltransferase domain-containing protein [Bryobacteraceae bacterium]|nr:methyltransferase domain-containing protein [Bryobacteraceae bacterium]
MTTSLPDFSGITEMAGDPASGEQIERMYARYHWAASHARGADVLEVACGSGQGLGYLARTAKRVVGADVTQSLVDAAVRHYGNRLEIRCFNAEEIPYPDASFDVILIFEAIYYVRDVQRFLREARRVLRPGGTLLIATANKDLFDFTPSPHSVAYYGVVELRDMLGANGFDVRFFGNTPITQVSGWQRVLRPVKLFVTRSGLMPKSKRMKAVLKRIVFGAIHPLPAEVLPDHPPCAAPTALAGDVPDRGHKVLFVEATRRP